MSFSTKAGEKAKEDPSKREEDAKEEEVEEEVEKVEGDKGTLVMRAVGWGLADMAGTHRVWQEERTAG